MEATAATRLLRSMGMKYQRVGLAPLDSTDSQMPAVDKSLDRRNVKKKPPFFGSILCQYRRVWSVHAFYSRGIVYARLSFPPGLVRTVSEQECESQ
jgi:hypothetical protein